MEIKNDNRNTGMANDLWMGDIGHYIELNSVIWGEISIDDNQIIGFGILFLVAMGLVVEVSYFIYLYTTADTVKCNFIFCEFTTTRVQSSQDCFMNGQRINCSTIVDQRI